jgi:RNA polymerase sigma-70 factor (ECF subfamily)
MKSRLPPFRGLFQAHYASVHDAALSSGVDESDAQDLAQMVWETVHRRLSEYDEHRSFRTWILGITDQIARNFRKMNRRRQRIFDRAQDSAEIEPSTRFGPATPEEELTRREQLAIAMEEIRRLPPDLQRVFLMAEVENLRHEDIAAQLGLSATTVAWRLRAAWEAIERGMHRRRLAGLLVAILAAGVSSLVALPAEARTLARRVRIAWKRPARRVALHAATVCVIGMAPMAGAALQVSSSALSQAAEQQDEPEAAQAPAGPRAAILAAVQAPSRPIEPTPRSRPPAPAAHAVRVTAEPPANPDRCESPPEVPPSNLAGELILLKRLRTALRAGNITLARQVLRGYDAQYPQGALRKERDQLAAEIAAKLMSWPSE